MSGEVEFDELPKTVDSPFPRDYKWKYDFLKAQLKRPAHLPKQFKMRVRRRQIFEDSFQQMQFNSSRVEVLKARYEYEYSFMSSVHRIIYSFPASGSSLTTNPVLTTAAWPVSGSTCCPRRCSTRTTASLSTRPSTTTLCRSIPTQRCATGTT